MKVASSTETDTTKKKADIADQNAAIAAAISDDGNVIMIDVDAIAKEVKSPRSANMVLLGAAASVLEMLKPEQLLEGITNVFASKGEAIVETNIAAFKAGYEFAQKNK